MMMKGDMMIVVLKLKYCYCNGTICFGMFFDFYFQPSQLSTKSVTYGQLPVPNPFEELRLINKILLSHYN